MKSSKLLNKFYRKKNHLKILALLLFGISTGALAKEPLLVIEQTEYECQVKETKVSCGMVMALYFKYRDEKIKQLGIKSSLQKRI